MGPDDDDDDDLRSTIESAYEAEPPDAGGEPEPAAPVTATAEPPAEPPASEPPEGKVRDALGRFVPKASGEGQKAVQEAKGGLPPTQAEKTPPTLTGEASQAIPAPPTWSPGAREHWSQIPAAAQQEIQRREHDMQRVLTETQQVRGVGDRFLQTIQPFLTTIQAEGVDPFTAVGNLMQVTTTLRMGTVSEKAALVAQVVKAYGVDIEALDNALVGQQSPQANGGSPQAIQQAVQQALAPLYQQVQQRQQAVAQQAENEAKTELEQFAADPGNEFFQDVRGIMADILDVADRQGQVLPLRDAYIRAAMLHPEVSKVIIARQQGASAQRLTAAAHKAKSSAVSVKGSAPSGKPDGVEPSSIRESIEAAIEAHSRF